MINIKRGRANLKRGCFLVEMCVKMSELGPIGRGDGEGESRKLLCVDQPRGWGPLPTGNPGSTPDLKNGKVK